MKLRIERAYHWFSIGSMAVAVGMICAGHTVLEPVLGASGALVSVLFWAVCMASVISTIVFAYLALLNAASETRALTAVAIQRSRSPLTPRRNSPVEQNVEV
jgi:hypothetical protein